MLLGFVSEAQLFEISNDPLFLDAEGKAYSMAFVGGLNQPQFSSMDINSDGREDLVVYDRSGEKVLTFIATLDSKGKLSYRYDPAYEDFFPEGKEFMLLVDYDGDDKPDVWTFTNEGIVLYKNNSGTLPHFDSTGILTSLDVAEPRDSSPYKNLKLVKGCLPAIVDLDFDGDIDFIANSDLLFSRLVFDKNVSVDDGLPKSDIRFERMDYCFGGVDELNFEMIINAPCLFREGYKGKKHTGTKTLLFYDEDGDGDKDLLYGSSEKISNPIYFFENGKADLNHYKDTFIRIDTGFFSPLVESQIPVAPGMFMVDTDLDGDLDLILSTNEVKKDFKIREKENVLLFENVSTGPLPDFQFKQNDFLVKDMINLGSNTAPVLADLDDDGDLDLIVATAGDHYYTGDTTDYLVYFENIGGPTNPKYQVIDADYLGLKSMHYRGMVPAFADLDGDADLDLYFGMSNGKIAYYENIGTKKNASFSLVTAFYSSIDCYGYAAPHFADLTGDGIQDLMLGTYDGNIWYYENIGTSAAPDFVQRTDTLGKIRVNKFHYTKIRDDYTLEVYYSYAYEHETYSAPSLMTWQDGTKALVVGAEEGKIRIFRLEDDLAGSFRESKEYMLRDFSKEGYIKDWGSRTYPATGDVNGDGIEDIFIGNSRGGIQYIEGKGTSLNSVYTKTLKSFKIHPNPSTGDFSIHTDSGLALEYSITNLAGSVVLSGSAFSGSPIATSSALSDGMYFVSIVSGEHHYSVEKLIISR
jgi:hypothetical protein